ncbi:MAG: hypothetical protein AB1540_16485 [Bdellovibrionota bacterium]
MKTMSWMVLVLAVALVPFLAEAKSQKEKSRKTASLADKQIVCVSVSDLASESRHVENGQSMVNIADDIEDKLNKKLANQKVSAKSPVSFYAGPNHSYLVACVVGYLKR